MKVLAVAAAILVAAAVLFPSIVYLGSEAMISRRYTLPSSVIQAGTTEKQVQWGKHVATLYGCRDCHGATMTGRMMTVPPGLTLAASNLRRFVAAYPDGDFDWAVREGLSPRARALWVMPSGSYVYMRDSDLAGILAWLKEESARGPSWPEPHFTFRARLAVLTGALKPVDPYRLGRLPPRNVGPRYDGGRYLAAMACSSCHGTDLTGSGAAPDLTSVSAYSRVQFFALMRHGALPPGRHAPRMARLSETRFSEFKDYEIDALYAYLSERARTAKPAH